MAGPAEQHPQHHRPRALVYGDVDLNLLDGSAIWLQSVSQALVAAGCAVTLVLKAPIRTDRLVAPLLAADEVTVRMPHAEQLLPGLKKAGSPEVALPQVFGHIRELLAEQRLNQLLHGWLATLRSASHIQTPQSGGGDQTP